MLQKEWKNTRKAEYPAKIRIICILLLAGSFFAALKCIFVCFQMDEEYAVSMPYRMLLGDKMFTQIWDPHQTSAFAIEFLLWIYKKLFSTTTGVVLFIRLCGTLIQGVIACGVYRVLRNFLNREYSFYLAILYFNLSPKGYVIPEFSNMLVWSFTLLLLALFRLYQHKNPFFAMESALWMCVMVLSYPSAILLFPFIFLYLWKQESYGEKSACIFTGACLLGGVCYLAYLFSYMSPATLFENIRYMLIGNSGHTETGTLGKLKIYGKDLLFALLLSLCYGLLAWLLLTILQKYQKTENKDLSDPTAARAARRFSGKFPLCGSAHNKNRAVLTVYLLLFLGAFHQLAHWVLMLWEHELSYIYTIYFILFGAAFYFGKQLDREIRNIMNLWLGGSLLIFLAVLILTDLTLFASVRYVIPGVIIAFMILILYAEKNAPEIFGKYMKALLLFWCFTSVFIKGWEYSDNSGVMKNVTCVRGIISEGPAKGILTEYMQSYMQESTYAEMQQYINPGDTLLLLDTGGTIGYLFQDVEVASYTTICDPRYNDILLKYWECNPDKYPDVIAVQCWYGELRLDSESWIMQWVENDFDAAQIIDGKYYRYYIRGD